MQDSIIAGNGNSRYLKTVAAALSLYPTYQDFMAALIAGTFPIDLNGINAAGWAQLGTALNKANLLSDQTSQKLGLGVGNVPTVDSAFNAVFNLVNTGWTKIQEYTSPIATTWQAPDIFNGKNYTIGVLVIGGGGSGASGLRSSDGVGTTGGASGYSVSFTKLVSPGSTHSVVVGAGGISIVSNFNVSPFYGNGQTGGSSTFDGIVALGGEGGKYGIGGNASGALGGQNSLVCITYRDGTTYPRIISPFGGAVIDVNDPAVYGSVLAQGVPTCCFNPFECKRILGAGGSAFSNTSSALSEIGGKDPTNNLGGGNGAATNNGTNAVAEAGSAPGCGGGAAAIGAYSATVSAISGAGAAGAIYIYVQGKVI